MKEYSNKNIFSRLQFIILIVCLLLIPAAYSISQSITKGLIGKQDLHLWDGTSTKTFTRTTSAGYTITLNDYGDSVDVKQVYGGGVNSTDTVLSAALTAIGTSNKVKLNMGTSTWTISSDLDLSTYTNILFDMTGGAMFSVSSGKTLTIYSPANIIAQPNQQIFTGDGTISFTKGGVGYFEWAGATGDGVTDDTTAMASILASGITRIIGQGGKTYLTTGVTIPAIEFDLDLGFSTMKLSGAGTLITVDNAGSQTDDVFIHNGYLVASTTGSGTAIYIEDTSRFHTSHININNFNKAYHFVNNNVWCESMLLEQGTLRGNNYGIQFEKVGASGSFAQTKLYGINITTTGAVGAAPYGVYIGTGANVYRSSFQNLGLWAGVDNSTMLYNDGNFVANEGIIHFERTSGTGLKAIEVDTNSGGFNGNLIIYASGAVWDANGDFIVNTAGVDFRGIFYQYAGRNLRLQGDNSSIFDVYDMDGDGITNKRFGISISSNDIPVIYSQDDTYGTLFADNDQNLGPIQAKYYTKAETITATVSGEIDVKDVNYLRLNLTNPENITDFINPIPNQLLYVTHINANATLVNGANIRLSGSANYTGAQYASHTFIYDGVTGGWRELSRIIP